MSHTTAQHELQSNLTTSYKEFSALMAPGMTQVNQVIRDRMISPVALISELAGHIIRSGGKRIRPMLTLAAAQLCGYQGECHVKLAACIEFIHTATLLHDDVIDESDMRRGQQSANAIWGNESSVLVGDFLFSRAFELMVEGESFEALRILSFASSTIVEGEILQLLTNNDIETGEEKYLEVVYSKTASLFAAACEVGAVVSKESEDKQEALRLYGERLGICFQIVDDLLDYCSEAETLGKNIGDDFREGKITLPVLLAYHAGNEHEKEFWKRTLVEMQQEQDDLGRATKLMQKHQVFAICRAKAREYAKQAAQALEIFEDSDLKTHLQNLAFFCVERAY